MRYAITTFLLAGVLASSAANAALGDLDSTFVPQLPASCDGAIVPLNDGGAFAGLAFVTSLLGNTTVGVARLDAAGKRLATWGDSGSVQAPSGIGFNAIRQIVPGADGSIYVLDTDSVIHIDANGRVDSGYGIGGRARLVSFQPLLAALQPDGKLVAFTFTGGSIGFTRIDERGQPDPSFGSGAPILVPLRTAPYGWAVRDDGVIEIGVREGPELAPALYTFSPFGFLTAEAGRILPYGAATWLSPTVKADPTGGVVFAANGYLERFGADSLRDPSFGTNGRTALPATIGVGLWRDIDGGWIAATRGLFSIGFSILDDDWVRVSRFTATGQPDPSFSAKRLDFLSVLERAPDGNFLACSGTSFRSSSLAKFDGGGPRAETTVVEYYHPVLDHYFLTSTPREIAGLDTEPFGWVRTGQSFGSWAPGNLAGAMHVCRFYGDPVIGPNSHFYTAEDFECQGLIDLDSRTPPGIPAWHLEGKPFDAAIPLNGECPANLQPVYRAFNGIVGRGYGPNHRYTTSTAVYDSMLAKGWIAEGVHFCAPPRVSD